MLHFRAFALRTAFASISIIAVGACGRSPTSIERLNGVFPLVKWDGLTVPYNLGSDPGSGAIPQPPCDRIVTGGSLTLNASSQTFGWGYDIVDCRGTVNSSARVTGSYVQSGSTIDFKIPVQGSVDLHFAGQVLADRIVIPGWEPTLEFRRSGG